MLRRRPAGIYPIPVRSYRIFRACLARTVAESKSQALRSSRSESGPQIGNTPDRCNPALRVEQFKQTVTLQLAGLERED